MCGMLPGAAKAKKQERPGSGCLWVSQWGASSGEEGLWGRWGTFLGAWS